MNMEKEEAIAFWRKSAKDDFDTAKTLYNAGKYQHSLFFSHLAIEKILKANLVYRDITPPYIHNLARLAIIAKLDISFEQSLRLKEITSFNLEARYDSEKLKFYRKATKDYTTLWIKYSEEILLWLDNLLN